MQAEHGDRLFRLDAKPAAGAAKKSVPLDQVAAQHETFEGLTRQPAHNPELVGRGRERVRHGAGLKLFWRPWAGDETTPVQNLHAEGASLEGPQPIAGRARFQHFGEFLADLRRRRAQRRQPGGVTGDDVGQ